MKNSVLLFSRIISQHPNLCSVFDRSILPIQNVVSQLLGSALRGGNYASIVKFICQISQEPELFDLFDGGLVDTVPLLLNSLRTPAVLNSMFAVGGNKKGKKRGVGVVDAILTFILRLCRGGYSDISQATREMRVQTTMADVRKRKVENRRTRRRGNDDSENEEEDNKERSAELAESKDTSVDSIEEWKQEVDRNCAHGREILKPHLGELLKNLEVLMSHRKSEAADEDETCHQDDNGNSIAVLPEKKQKNSAKHHGPNATIMMKGFEILIELTQHMVQDVETTCKLIELLVVNLPKKKRVGTRTISNRSPYRMVLASIRELLRHFDGVNNQTSDDEQSSRRTAEKTLSLLTSVLTKQLQVSEVKI